MYLATKLTVGKRHRHISVDAPVNTTSRQQLLYYDFVSAALCSTGDLLRESEAHCYTKRHAKIMLLIQCADNRCNNEYSGQSVRPLNRITSYFPVLCMGQM